MKRTVAVSETTPQPGFDSRVGRVLCRSSVAWAGAFVAGFAGVTPAWANEAAIVVRRTELRQEPFDDAAKVADLAERAAVRLMGRQGGWLQVQAPPHTGWLRLLAVRTATPAAVPAGDSSLKTALNVARTGSSGQTVATGVRGLDKADLAQASPDPQRVAQLEQLAATKEEAEAFGRRQMPPPATHPATPLPAPAGKPG